MNLQTVGAVVVGGTTGVRGVKGEKGGSPRFTGMTLIVVHVKTRITCAQVVFLCFMCL